MPFVFPTPELTQKLSVATILNVLPTTLVAREAKNVDHLVAFHFPDTQEHYSVHIRQGVAEVQPYTIPNPDNSITIDSKLFKELAVNLRSPLQVFASGEMEITGNKKELLSFMQLFKTVE